MTHIMLDLETMGNSSNAAIIAIGAVAFDYKSTREEFYQVVDLQSSVDVGLTIDCSTVLWWLKQNDQARQQLHTPNEGTELLPNALTNFGNFLYGVRKPGTKVKLWGNGAAFDNVILANAYRKCEFSIPWEFWNNRCYRTLKSMAKQITMNRQGTYHNALDDAKSQALHLIDICRSIGMNLN